MTITSPLPPPERTAPPPVDRPQLPQYSRRKIAGVWAAAAHGRARAAVSTPMATSRTVMTGRILANRMRRTIQFSLTFALSFALRHVPPQT